jgi:PIN domain nuclease of toxin-antitoxin system
VRLLLDTHVWLWMIGQSSRLGHETRSLLTDEANDLYLSTVAAWEIGIKHAAGRLKFTGKPSVQLPGYVKRSGVQPLVVTLEHALRAAELPMHHRDPFDRLMIAQAQEEELTFVTADSRLAAYDVPILDPSAEASP